MENTAAPDLAQAGTRGTTDLEGLAGTAPQADPDPDPVDTAAPVDLCPPRADTAAQVAPVDPGPAEAAQADRVAPADTGGRAAPAPAPAPAPAGMVDRVTRVAQAVTGDTAARAAATGTNDRRSPRDQAPASGTQTRIARTPRLAHA